MDRQFDLELLKTSYSSLLEHICSDKDFLKSSNNISNIWKTTDQLFLRHLGSFFIKQPDAVKSLVPSSKLYSEIVSFCEKNGEKELLKWVKSFNNHFISSVTRAMKKNKTDEHSLCDFNENLRKCSDIFYKLKLRNENLEKKVDELQNELKLSHQKNALLTSSLENLAHEECENFRKRMRTKIYEFSIEQATTV